MYCTHCGTQLPSNANYCMNCGKAVERRAPESSLPFGMPEPPPAQPKPFGQPQSFEPQLPVQPTLPGQPEQPGQSPQVQSLFAVQPPLPGQAQPDAQETGAAQPEQQAFYQPGERRGVSKQSMGLIAVAIVIIAGGLLFYGFANREGAQSTPEKTVESFIEAVGEGDGEAMIKLFTPDSLPDGTEERAEVVKQFEMSAKETDIIDYEIEEADIQEDKATVEYTVTYEINGDEQGDDSSFELVLIDDKWYIDGDR